MMNLKKCAIAVLMSASAAMAPARASEPVAEHWKPIGRLIGTWAGVATGAAGTGTVSRQYAWVMNHRFVQEVNTSRYPPKEANKSGEVHEHRSMFSYDKARKLIVLRQFHIEGFVNQYRQAPSPENSESLTFESESFENFSNTWKARESYEFRSDDEFIETFELAPPNKPYQVYSRNHFTRVAK